MGSLVVGAKVTIKNSRGVTTSATSDSSGVYQFRRVEPGTYELHVTAPGFNMFEEKEVEVSARETTTLNAQLTIAVEDQQVTVDDSNISTDSDNNASAIVLRGKELEALPNDPQALAMALQALAGPSDPENPSQMKVDGFSNGQLPPKEAIREVRINNNPFSAENEFPGFGGIEIFTQPGADKWHGGFSFDFNDEALNSRNPFTTTRAPYQQRAYGANLSGPIIPKRASFSAYFGRWVSDANSVVNATTLDPITLKPVVVNDTFITPDTNSYGNARVDFKINKAHTLVARFNYSENKQDLQGIGGFSLPSRAYSGKRSNFIMQITETALLNEKTVNETRFQYIRNRFRQASVLDAFALNVSESFFGGGAQVGASSNAQNRMELQNFTSWTHGNHFLKAGVRIRHVDLLSVSPGNFGGTYTFAGGLGPALDANDQIIPGQVPVQVSSLERYRRTLAFSRAGLGGAAIRLLGGGPDTVFNRGWRSGSRRETNRRVGLPSGRMEDPAQLHAISRTALREPNQHRQQLQLRATHRFRLVACFRRRQESGTGETRCACWSNYGYARGSCSNTGPGCSCGCACWSTKDGDSRRRRHLL